MQSFLAVTVNLSMFGDGGVYFHLLKQYHSSKSVTGSVRADCFFSEDASEKLM